MSCQEKTSYRVHEVISLNATLIFTLIIIIIIIIITRICHWKKTTWRTKNMEWRY